MLLKILEWIKHPEAILIVALIGFSFGSATGHYMTKVYYRSELNTVKAEYAEYKADVLTQSAFNTKVALEQSARMFEKAAEQLSKTNEEIKVVSARNNELVRRIKNGEFKDAPVSESLDATLDSLRNHN